MKLLSILLAIVLFLPSCAVICPQPKQVLFQDQQGFSQAFDDFQLTHRIDKLQIFKTDYPDSVWVTRADTVILYSQELDQRKLQIEKLRESKRQQALELKKLKESNQRLTKMIEQLKSSLIQSEKHLK